MGRSSAQSTRWKGKSYICGNCMHGYFNQKLVISFSGQASMNVLYILNLFAAKICNSFALIRLKLRSQCSGLLWSIDVAWKIPVQVTSFLYENGRKIIRFYLITLIYLITDTEPNISVFVRSHCSGFVMTVVEDSRFPAFSNTLIFVAIHFR